MCSFTKAKHLECNLVSSVNLIAIVFSQYSHKIVQVTDFSYVKHPVKFVVIFKCKISVFLVLFCFQSTCTDWGEEIYIFISKS